MRRVLPPVLSSALLTVFAVPALLAVPVVGPVRATAHPVEPTLTTTALSGVDAAALAEVTSTPPALSPSATPRPVVAAGLRRPAVLTAKRRTARFDLVALTWRRAAAAPGTEIQVRVREQGRWSAWRPLDVDSDGPDAGTAEAAAATGVRDGTAPLLASAADGVQVRVDTPDGVAPAGLALVLVDAGRSRADGGSGPAQSAVAATPRPRLVTRADWGADESLVKAPPVVNPAVKTLVLHHTATTNAYTAAQAYAQIRSVYAFHTKGRGWNDIGYNFLVDRYGRVFEGRRGSLVSPIMGAHTGGFNSSSLGVSVLGTYSTAAPPQAALNAVIDVMAWQAAQYGINPRGATSVISAGGSATKYRAGTAVRVTGIVGHRDLGLTECPGNALYPKLGAIRSAVAARMVPDLIDPDLDGGPAPAAGAPVRFTAAVPTRQRWSMTVTPMCGTTPVRTLSGTTSSRIGGSWDLKDSAGRVVPPGVYSVAVTTSSPVGVAPVWREDVEVLTSGAWLFPTADPSPTQSPTPSPTASPTVGSPVGSPVSSPVSSTGSPTGAPIGAPSGTATPTPTATPSPTPPPATSSGCSVQRAAGADPVLTSLAAGRTAYPDARTVVLVNATGNATAFGDAVAGAPLAVAEKAPLLLTGTVAVPDPVVKEILARKVTTVYLVGSTASIGAAVEHQLRALGVPTVTRVAGPDRWGTAAAVARRVGAPARQAVLVPGDPGELLDALVAAGAAAGTGRPVLLTGRTGVPAATLAALKAMKVSSVTVVGSTVAVPESTLSALAGAGVTKRTRLVGKGRWATAVALADTYGPKLPAGPVVLTSGLTIGPDLLVASSLGRSVLLASADVLPTNTAAWLAAHPSAKVSVVGPPALVGTPVLKLVQSTRR